MHSMVPQLKQTKVKQNGGLYLHTHLHTLFSTCIHLMVPQLKHIYKEVFFFLTVYTNLGIHKLAERGVIVGDIGLVMLLMMELHDLWK